MKKEADDDEEGESSYYDTEEESDQEEKQMQAAIAASLGSKTEGVSAVYSAALNAEEEDSQFKQAAEIMAAAAPLKENVIDISGNY